ncbi:MAG: phosphatidylglycerophosphatase A [Phycisphaerales bacterium]
MTEVHKNKFRAPLKPLDLPTLGLSVGGLGFLRPAPGTWGSVPPPAVAFVLALYGVGFLETAIALSAVCLIACAACVVWGGYAESRFGRKDAPEVVADETAGCALPVIVAASFSADVPIMFAQLAWAFVLFRIMDILKPWPARRLEQLPRGWGVLVDDLVAGLYAAIAFFASMWALSALGMR